MPKRSHDHDCPRTLCICASGAEDEPEWSECACCGTEIDSGEEYCSDECEVSYNAEPEPDPTPCNHPAHEWRRCPDCKAAYGDLQYQRMKEGEL